MNVCCVEQLPLESWEIMWCYTGWYEVANRLERMLPSWAVLRRMESTSPLHLQVSNSSVLIPTTGCVDEKVIRAAKNCKLIAQPAAGHDNIAVSVARELGIPVTIAPASNSHSVAEATLMMVLMLARRADEAQKVFQERRIGEPVGFELHGKTLGIIGMGSIGNCLLKAAKGLGMKVIGTTSKSSREDLDHLLRTSHVISINCPLNDRTSGLIGDAELSMMMPDAILVNSSRGPVIDKDALHRALLRGHLSGVGLDVHWVEPADPQEPLYLHPRVLAMPHMGTITHEVYDRFAQVLCENIIRAYEGRDLLNRIC